MITSLLLFTDIAGGCTCFETPLAHLLPEPGDVDVPLNARVSVILQERAGPEPSLELDGQRVSAEVRRTEMGVYSHYILVPNAPLLPDRTYTVTVLGSLDYPFTTGDQVDITPPVFDQVEVRSTQRDVCGEALYHNFTILGQRGEYGPDRVWVSIVPVAPGMPSVLFGGGGGSVSADTLCSSNDDTLWDTLHRDYIVTVTDVAGNEALPVSVATRGKGVTVSSTGEIVDRVGCSMGPRTAGPLWLLARRRATRTGSGRTSTSCLVPRSAPSPIPAPPTGG